MKRIHLGLMAGMLGLVACHSGMSAHINDSTTAASSAAAPQMAPFDVNRYAVNNTVCNPLGGSSGSSTNPTQGIQATLWYLSATQPRYTNVEDMITNGNLSSQQIFFNLLNVPTRLFSEGFPLQTGGSVLDDSGNELIEYFALRFQTVLHLGPNDPPGNYQLGLLSDDGTIWSLALNSETGAYTTVVDNDGTHPTQMGCGQVVNMTASSNYNMQLDYYQGPRYEIALVPLWRQVTTTPPVEPLCGQEGNSLYFDPNNNSTPEAAYTQLLARGWHPLTADNYSIQTAASYNPCTQGTAPVISNVAVVNDYELGYFLVTWNTDILATDQVLVTNTGTGVQTLTTSDNVLRTSHSVPVTGLSPGSTYTFQAVSVSQSLGQTISPAVTVTLH